jgi:hypothetical protein
MQTKDPKTFATLGSIYLHGYNDGQHVLPQYSKRAFVLWSQGACVLVMHTTLGGALKQARRKLAIFISLQ